MRRGSSVREECDHFTRDEKAHSQSACGLMHSPDYGNEKAIIHITNVVHIWESAPTWRMFFYQNIFYCNKVNTAVTFLFAHCADRTHLCTVKKGNLKPASVRFQPSMGRLKSFFFAGADRIHTWFSDIGECLTDWPQTKHILGLHFEVVPGGKQTTTEGFNKRFGGWSVILPALLWLGGGEENVNDHSRWLGMLQTGSFESSLFYIRMNPKWAQHNKNGYLADVEERRREGQRGEKETSRQMEINR